MNTLLWIIAGYLALGWIGALLINWQVERGAPVGVVVWVFGCAVVMVPYVCVRHRVMPWRLDMVVGRGGL